MKKAIFLAAGIVLIAAGCSKGSPTTSTSSTQAGSSAQTTHIVSAQATQGQSSFKDLMAMGIPQKCDANFTSGQTATQGTLYLIPGEMRGDFTAQDQGKTIQSHMIVKDQTVYSWMEGAGMNMAFKTAVSTSTSASQSQSANVNQEVNYSCQSWTEDDSMFDLPAGVTFSDQASMMQNMAPPTMPDKTTSPSAQECAACNSLSANAKAACLTALKCN